MYKQAIIVLGLVVSFSSVTQAGLVGTGSGGFIYDIDTATGIASNARQTDVPLSAVAFGDGTLYAASLDKLYTVDATTGELRLLGQLQGFEGSLLRALTWDAETGALFGIGHFGGTGFFELEAINLDTLAVTSIGSVPGASALAFDGNGMLFALGSGQEQFFRLDKTNAQVLSSASLSQFILDPVGMAFDNDGTLFVSATIDGESVLHTLDPLNGAVDALGVTGAPGGIFSLAYVPEPGTLFLFGSGVLVILRRRRRASPAQLQGVRQSADRAA